MCCLSQLAVIIEIRRSWLTGLNFRVLRWNSLLDLFFLSRQRWLRFIRVTPVPRSISEDEERSYHWYRYHRGQQKISTIVCIPSAIYALWVLLKVQHSYKLGKGDVFLGAQRIPWQFADSTFLTVPNLLERYFFFFIPENISSRSPRR